MIHDPKRYALALIDIDTQQIIGPSVPISDAEWALAARREAQVNAALSSATDSEHDDGSVASVLPRENPLIALACCVLRNRNYRKDER